MYIAQIQSIIPIQLFLLSFSLKRNIPTKLELITIPILVKVKTIELSKLGVANALKKNTRQKKFGMPKVTPQNTSPSLTDFSSFVNFIK